MTEAAPITLGVNALPRFYTGGARIAAFRRVAAAEVCGPEDWIGSTTVSWGGNGQGLSRLPDGRLLRDAVHTDPEALLGPAHVAAFGSDPGLLVKLLDAGERLAVHVHPDDGFAHRVLDRPCGKTEAWIILAAEPGSAVHVGFRAPVAATTLRDWVDRQDVAAMLDALNPVAVAPGDALLVPAGLPHAIDAGILLLELQQPSDLSIMLEAPHDGDRYLGLSPDVALGAVDRSATDAGSLRGPLARGFGVCRLLAPAADPFFRAERIESAGSLELDAGYSILVVLEGTGELAGAGGAVDLEPGTTVVVPYAAGRTRIAGELLAIRCRPPEPRRA